MRAPRGHQRAVPVVPYVAGGKFFGTTICAAAVVGVTGGIGTPGVVGCSAVGSAVGSATESLAT
jgi:hypothetical protein